MSQIDKAILIMEVHMCSQEVAAEAAGISRKVLRGAFTAHKNKRLTSVCGRPRSLNTQEEQQFVAWLGDLADLGTLATFPLFQCKVCVFFFIKFTPSYHT